MMILPILQDFGEGGIIVIRVVRDSGAVESPCPAIQ
jgi:hypothetical protein